MRYGPDGQPGLCHRETLDGAGEAWLSVGPRVEVALGGLPERKGGHREVGGDGSSTSGDIFTPLYFSQHGGVSV